MPHLVVDDGLGGRGLASGCHLLPLLFFSLPTLALLEVDVDVVLGGVRHRRFVRRQSVQHVVDLMDRFN